MLLVAVGLAGVAALGAVVLFLVALVLLAARRLNPRPLFASRLELCLVGGSVLAAVLGSSLLFTFPAYSGGGARITVSSTGKSTVTAMPETGRSFYAVNGPQVIPFFTVPITFTFLPFAVARWRGRAAVESVAAFLLAAMSAVGMSGFGFFFAPSAFLMLVAGVAALRAHGAQQALPADVAASQPRG